MTTKKLPKYSKFTEWQNFVVQKKILMVDEYCSAEFSCMYYDHS